MEASRREQIVLLGVVPILAAALGAVITVLAQKYFGSGDRSAEAVLAVLKMPGVSPSDRIKLISAVTQDSERCFDVLDLMLGALGVPIGFLLAIMSFTNPLDFHVARV